MEQTNENRNNDEKAKTKASKDEVSRRVTEVLNLRLDGAGFHDILQYASEKGWDVGERQLRNYVAKSDEIFARHREKGADKVFNRHVAMRMRLYARAMAVSDYSTAKAVLRDLGEIEGVYPAPKKAVPPQENQAPQSVLVLSGFDPVKALGLDLVGKAPDGYDATSANDTHNNRIAGLEDGD